MTIREKIARSYCSAVRMQQSGDRLATPVIHIGLDVLDYLRSLTTTETTAPRPTLWGFPVVVEPEWTPDRIVVRTEQEIM